jgi:predicted transcriptional regulator
MSGKRNRIEIMSDMLEFIRDKDGKAKLTHIMYKANLSNEMLYEYLKELSTKEFIIEHKDKDKRKTYRITDKGLKFLADYKPMKEFLASYDLN